ncbi:MAG: PASTA domain-containing protein, partial [Niameybacter sp.]
MTSPGDLYQAYEDEEEEEDEEVPTGYKVLAGIGGVLATLVLAGIVATIIFFVLPSFSKPEYELVPEMVGKTIEEATRLLEGKDLKIEKVGEKQSDRFEAGLIIEQTPAKEKLAEPGTTIQVVVASSEEPVAEVNVPHVIGLRLADAQRELEKYKLEFIREYKYDDGSELNEVLEQSIEAGERVAEGSVLTLVVSKGPKEVLAKVPDL